MLFLKSSLGKKIYPVKINAPNKSVLQWSVLMEACNLENIFVVHCSSFSLLSYFVIAPITFTCS